MTHPASCGVLMPESGADGLILVQHAGADGEELRHFLTGVGTFVVSDGVTSIWVELIGGGAKEGSDGEYLAEPLSVQPGESIAYSVGRSGLAGADAEQTTFGQFCAKGGRAPVGSATSPALRGWVQRLS